MATEKRVLEELQRRKRDSIAEIMNAFSKAFKDGTLRKISDPKPI